MLHLTEADVRQRLDVRALIPALAEAFKRLPDVHLPPRTCIELAPGTSFLTMTCDDTGLDVAGIKLASVSPQAGVQATYFLLDRATGAVRGSLSANWLTDARTAATSALATDCLARGDAKTLTIFGTGRLARAHAEVLPLVRKFERILIVGRNTKKAVQFAGEIEHAGPAEAESATRLADVICCCTTSPSPLFRGEWLKPGCHINACGAFRPHTRETDDETVRRARIVVDTYAGALAEAGDLLVPLRNKVITRDRIVADLHELVTGKKQVLTNADNITLFKSVGCALEDLVAASLVMRAAEQRDP